MDISNVDILALFAVDVKRVIGFSGQSGGVPVRRGRLGLLAYVLPHFL